MVNARENLQDSMAVEMTEHNAAQAVSKLRHLFGWAYQEKMTGRQVQAYVLTGVADPYVWNNLHPQFNEMLRQGVYYEHLLGPVLATLNGENKLMDMLEKYRGNTRCKLLMNRAPSHWTLIGSTGRDSDLRFRLLIEKPHPLVSRTFSVGEMSLISQDDENVEGKKAAYAAKLAELCLLHEEAQEITCVDDMETMELWEIEKAYSAMRKSGCQRLTLNAAELRRFLHVA